MPISPFSRRGFIAGSAAVAAFAMIHPARVWADPIFTRYPFRLGVASGDPLPDGVVLWTRLAPEPLHGGGMPMRAVEVGWEIAADARFRDIVQQGKALARPELGHSVHVEASGLSPARPYWYRFRAGQEISPIGRTKTAPEASATADRVTFVNAGCQRYEDGHFTAWRHIAGEELDFVFHYGDYIYERRNRPNANLPVAGRDYDADEIHTVADYRNRYALYKLDPDLQAAHAVHPFIVTYDDHEVDNNWAGAYSEEDGGEGFPIAVPPEFFAFRKQMALQAWYEAMPVRRAQLPRGTDITAYRKLSFGNLVAFHALDTRQFRDDQPCRGATVACDDRLRPGSQILGDAQEKWLMQGLRDSRAKWNVLAQQVTMMQRRSGEGPNYAYSLDKWDAYPDARNRLLKFVSEARVQNLCVLTGDVHNAWVGELKADFADEKSLAVGTEFVATSITSTGDGAESTPAAEAIIAKNPHIKFFNDRRGYTVHEATPTKMTAHFRAVPYVTRQGAPLETKASFVVEAGSSRIARA